MYIPLIWQFESDVKKGEGYKVVKKNVISTFSSVAKFFFILKGIIQGLRKIYNLTISTSRSNKNSSIKFNACSYVMPIFPSPRFYSSLTLSLSITLSLRPHSGFHLRMKSSQRRKMILPMKMIIKKKYSKKFNCL